MVRSAVVALMLIAGFWQAPLANHHAVGGPSVGTHLTDPPITDEPVHGEDPS